MEDMSMDQRFWRGKRVFVTGHTGFKGSWISLWLQRLGAELTGYALHPPTQPSLFNAADVGRDMRSIIGDVRDLDSLKRAMSEAKPEIVLHLAAQSLVRRSYDDPVETYSTNVMGLVNLLEAVRATSSVRSVVNVTSDKCYENKEWPWGYRENEPMGGYDPYSNSKGCAELVTAAYRSSYFNTDNYGAHGVAIASARAGNVIGGGDWAHDRLIPDMLRAIGQGKAVMVRNPHAIRPWQHVLEPLNGYLTLAEKLFQHGPIYSEGWNFGPDETDVKSVEWIVERMTQVWGEGAAWKSDGAPQPHEATYLKLDCSKARARLDWHPRWSIALAVEKIVEWHKACEQRADMRQMTFDQINDYSAH